MRDYVELTHKILENDKDRFISLETYKFLQAYGKEKIKGTLISHKKLKKKLGT